MKTKRTIALMCSILLLLQIFPVIRLSVHAEPDKIIITLPEEFATSLTVNDKVYDGTTDAAVDYSAVQLIGMEGDSNVVLTGDAVFEAPNAGQNVAVFVSNLRLEGPDADLYELSLTEEQQMITLFADIAPIVLYLTPDGTLVQGESLPKEIAYEWDRNAVLPMDAVEVTAHLYIDKTDDGYIYTIDDTTATGNPNYVLGIPDGLTPDVELPPAPSITSAIVSKDQATELNQFDFGIVANSSVKLTITAESAYSFPVEFRLSDGQTVIVTDSEEISEEVGNSLVTKYLFVAEFIESISTNETARVQDISCTVDNGTVSDVIPLAMRIENHTATTSHLILDKKEPATANVTVTYNNRQQKFTATGSFTDYESGIRSIRFKWDNQPWQQYEVSSNRPSAVIQFENSVNYSDAQYVPLGLHRLYLEIVDNAGAVHTENGLYCLTNYGPDTYPPDVTYINLETTDETSVDTALRFFPFGNISKKDLVLSLKVVDRSQSGNISGVASVELLDGDGDGATVLNQLVGSANSDYVYSFTISPDIIIDNWCIRVSDVNGHAKTMAVSSLLKSDIAVDPSPEPEPSGDEEVPPETPSTFEWDFIDSDKWIFDSTAPNTNQFEYEGEIFEKGTHYFNFDGGKLIFKASDEGGLESVTVSQKYRQTVDTDYTEMIQLDAVSYASTDSIHNEYHYEIDTSSLDTGWYYFVIEANDLAGNPTSSAATLVFVDHASPEGEIAVVSPSTTKVDEEIWVPEKDENGELLPITFRLYADAKGADLLKLQMEINGEKYDAEAEGFSNENGRTFFDVTIMSDELPFNEENIYEVSALITAESHNTRSTELTLHVDTENPVVDRFTVEKKNSAAETVLNVLSFGVFSNDSIRLSVNVRDGEHDCGVQDVTIKYAGLDVPVSMTKQEDGIYFYDLDISTKVFQSDIAVTVYDKIGKYNLTCPNIENTDREQGVSDSCFVMLETVPPQLSVILPPTDSTTRDDGQIWYREHSGAESDPEKMIRVTVQDIDSGIRSIDLRINGQSILPFSTEIEENGQALPTADTTLQMGAKDRRSLCNVFSFHYSTESVAEKISANEDGSYIIELYVVDNAGNVTTVPVSDSGTPYSGGKVVYYRDNLAPSLVKFSFDPASYDGITDADQFIEKLEYGYYYKRTFNVTLTAQDPLPSSQLNVATFRLVSYKDGVAQAPEIYEVAIKDGKAAFTVNAGFKGQIFGRVNDKVNNVSEERTPQGFVIDDTAPTISIEPLPNQYSGLDNNHNKLYTESVQFRVTITDTQSGLRSVGFSKSSENDSFGEVLTAIDNTQGYNGESQLANGWRVTKTDENLVTSVSQVFTFDKDDNDIRLTFSAMDRSGNASQPESSEAFTIDLIAPQIAITSAAPLNDSFYQDETQITIRIVERNFSSELINGRIVNSFTSASPAIVFRTDPNDSTVHIATVTFPEGDYEFSLSGSDLGGHRAVIRVNGGEPNDFYVTSFNVDATAPVIVTNFDHFGTDGDPNIFFNQSQVEKIENGKATPLLYAIITVTEHNFDMEDMHISVLAKAPGTEHTTAWTAADEMGYYATWQHDGDTHTLQIAFAEDGVYKINMSPIDRATNTAYFDNHSLDHTAVFEVDKTPPVYYARTDEFASDNGFVATPFYDVYDERRKDEKAPSVEFRDTNFDRIEVTALIYTPSYENGMELGKIKPSQLSEKLSVPVRDNVFTLTDFKEDGVYAMTFVAVDKAGNRSPVISNTYFRMVFHDVLAYMPGSKKPDGFQKGTGFYSLMYESEGSNGQINYRPISKKATGFDDIDVYVIRPTSNEEIGTLYYQKDESVSYFLSEYSGFTTQTERISETATMVKMHIPKEYYSETFKDDGLNTRMDLMVTTQKGNPVWLASIHIDNERPSATIPDDFRSGKIFFFEKEHTIVLTDISEILADDDRYESKTIVYECPRNGERTEIPHIYNAQDNTLSFTLSKGIHHIDIVLVDEAGNEFNIDRVKYLVVGNYVLYACAGLLLISVAAVLAIRQLRKRKNKGVKMGK